MTADHHAIDIDHHVKIYLRVFYALMLLTCITVGVSYLHLSFAAGVTLALAIALIKGGLVACYFMHLISEQKMIYAALAMTVVFFFVLLISPVWWSWDPITIR